MKINQIIRVMLPLLAMTGCASIFLGDPENKSVFALAAIECASPKTDKPLSEGTLLLRGMKSQKFLDSDRIIFRSDSITVGSYQFASWLDTPPHQLTVLLRSRLECGHIFNHIIQGAEPSSSQYLLSTELVDFSHNAQIEPGSAHVAVRAELYRTSDGAILGTKVFETDEALKDFSARGAVEALSLGSQKVVDGIVGWVSEIEK